MSEHAGAGVNEDAEVERALAGQPWDREGDLLTREVTLRDFDAAFDLVGRVARQVDDYGRRPDMCISEFNRVRLTIANPHHAGITLAEVRLAAKVDAAIGEPAGATGRRV
jgi:pterin-4a-carbinolamine dehydratase